MVNFYMNERSVALNNYGYRSLRGRIIEKFGSNKMFAQALGLSENSLSKKLTCKTAFDQNDIEHWCKLLDIEHEKIPVYFFT